jgi:hypothetical protein
MGEYEAALCVNANMIIEEAQGERFQLG